MCTPCGRRRRGGFSFFDLDSFSGSEFPGEILDKFLILVDDISAYAPFLQIF
jgi:hypothetical protein